MVKDEIKIYVSFESMVLSIAPKTSQSKQCVKMDDMFLVKWKKLFSVVVLGLTSQYDVRVLISP